MRDDVKGKRPWVRSELAALGHSRAKSKPRRTSEIKTAAGSVKRLTAPAAQVFVEQR